MTDSEFTSYTQEEVDQKYKDSLISIWKESMKYGILSLTESQSEVSSLTDIKDRYLASTITAQEALLEVYAINNIYHTRVETAKQNNYYSEWDVTAFGRKSALFDGTLEIDTAPFINADKLIDASDDVSAAAAGVEVNQMYRTGSDLKIRVA